MKSFALLSCLAPKGPLRARKLPSQLFSEGLGGGTCLALQFFPACADLSLHGETMCQVAFLNPHLLAAPQWAADLQAALALASSGS